MLLPEDIQPMLQPLLVSRGLPVNKEIVKLWCIGLAGLSVEEVNAAVAGFVQQSTEFPTPAAVRKYAGPRGLDDDSRALSAWGQVLDKIRKVGAYASVDFEDRLTNAAIRELGGWVALCDTSSEEMVWRQKEFVRVYAMLAKTGVGDASPLPGIEAATNAKLGYDAKPPVVVPARLPEHATEGRIERREPDPPKIEGAKMVDVASLVPGLMSYEKPKPPQPERPLPTEDEVKAFQEEQLRKLAAWERSEEQFKQTCRGVA